MKRLDEMDRVELYDRVRRAERELTSRGQRIDELMECENAQRERAYKAEQDLLSMTRSAEKAERERDELAAHLNRINTAFVIDYGDVRKGTLIFNTLHNTPDELVDAIIARRADAIERGEP